MIVTKFAWNLHRIRPIICILVFLFSATVLYLIPSHLSSFRLIAPRETVIWLQKRKFEWRPCNWWNDKALTGLSAQKNGYIRVDCYGGLNQMRRDLCDGIGIARLLNATLVLPKFEVAAYWNETSGFADVFDVDYFIETSKGFIDIVKELPDNLSSKEPFKVDCSKKKGNFDYVEVVLPSLLEHQYISITPAMSQRRDRYPRYAKATQCQACYKALRLTTTLQSKGAALLNAIPKPFLTLHLRFEPDMVAYSRCQYPSLSPSSQKSLQSSYTDDLRKPYTGEAALKWRARGKCPLTPNETSFILQSLNIPTTTNIYLAAGDGLMEIEGLMSVYKNVYTKASLMREEDFVGMHGNTKAALDYYVSVNSDEYVATYFGNMDKMVAAMRALEGRHKTLFLNRKAFSVYSGKGLIEEDLKRVLWEEHRREFVLGRGSALPDCFCEFSL